MKYLEATLKLPIVVITSLEVSADELTNAGVIEHAQAHMVYEMRKALEKKMAELTREDLTFSLKETP